MKLIGITGMAGSGKTTFSNMLAQNQEIGVIHVDDLLKKIKLKYFSFIMKENAEGEKTKVDSNLKTLLYRNKILFNMFMKFRSKLIQKLISDEIHKEKILGKKVIIVDDAFIQHQKCYKDLSLIILMERPYIDRRYALMEREKLTKAEIVAYDIAHYTGNYKDTTFNRKTIKIKNNNTKEELSNLAEYLYQEKFSDFKSKYTVKNIKANVHETIPTIMDINFKNIEKDEK